MIFRAVILGVVLSYGWGNSIHQFTFSQCSLLPLFNLITSASSIIIINLYRLIENIQNKIKG